MTDSSDILSRIEAAFRFESGPARAMNPSHCEECAAADEELCRLDPRDINTGDLTDEAQNWIFSFASNDSLRWLTPGIVRVALNGSTPRPMLFFDLISQRTSNLFTDDQWLVLLDLAEHCRSNGWITREALSSIGPAGNGGQSEP